MSTTDTLDDDHPLWLINEQIKGLLEGDGASEDHEDVVAFLRKTGLPEGTVARIHRALVCAEKTARLRAELDALRKQKEQVPFCRVEDAKHIYELACALGVSGSAPLYLHPFPPAPKVPVAAIEKVLSEAMEIAVSNGANSVSMPDEYVEIAAWLHNLAAVPKPEGTA